MKGKNNTAIAMNKTPFEGNKFKRQISYDILVNCQDIKLLIQRTVELKKHRKELRPEERQECKTIEQVRNIVNRMPKDMGMSEFDK